MPDHSLFQIFISRLNELNIRYMVTGAVATIIYGEPRLTHDIDIVIEISGRDVNRIIDAFPSEEFYCPPEEVIRVESKRPVRGHFNITLTLQKSWMPQIQDGKGEAVARYREPLTTQEMGYRRLSHRVNNMAAFDRFQDVTWSDFQRRTLKNA